MEHLLDRLENLQGQQTVLHEKIRRCRNTELVRECDRLHQEILRTISQLKSAN